MIWDALCPVGIKWCHPSFWMFTPLMWTLLLTSYSKNYTCICRILRNGTKYIDHLDSKQASYINKYKKEIRPMYYHHHHHLAINCTCITFKRFLYALTYWLFTGTCNYVVTFNFRLIEYYLKLKGFTLPFKDQTLLNRTKY